MKRTLQSLAFVVIAALLATPCLTLLSKAHASHSGEAVAHLKVHKPSKRCQTSCTFARATTDTRRKDQPVRSSHDGAARIVHDHAITRLAGDTEPVNLFRHLAGDLGGRDLLTRFCRLLT